MLLAQLNRALEAREDKRPGLADLRESGDLEADADVVVFLHREAHRILKSPEFRAGSAEAHARYAAVEREAELIVGKNRAGPERTVKLWCLPSCSTSGRREARPYLGFSAIAARIMSSGMFPPPITSSLRSRRRR